MLLTLWRLRAEKPLMGYVYYCVFCGFHTQADEGQATGDTCGACGGALRVCTAPDYPAIAAALEQGRDAHRPHWDGALPLVALVAAPWLLGLLAGDLRDLSIAVGVMFLVMGGAVAAGAANRPGEPVWAWRAYAAATFAGALALILAGFESDLRLCAAAAGGLFMIVGFLFHLRARTQWLHPTRLLGAASLMLPATAGVGYFVVDPALHRSNARGAIAVLAALAAFWLAAALSACGRRTTDKRLGRRLWAVAGGAVAACSLAVVNGPHAAQISASILAVGGWVLASAAVAERPAPTERDAEPEHPTAQTVLMRILLPTAELTAFAGLAAWALARDGVSAWPLAWFGSLFVLAATTIFTRQALLDSENAVALSRERRARRAAQTRIETLVHSAPIDEATGFASRPFFEATLESEVRRGMRYHSPSALALFQVDGEAVTDETLAYITSIVEPILRDVDTLGRIGATSFALLMPETTQLDGLIAAERIRAAISRSDLGVTVSAGIGAYPEDAAGVPELLRRTSGALKWARTNGADLCAVVNRSTDRALAAAPEPAA
ncbi:MAG: two-component system, cell cycle response regulator [Solirubrobacteraceae bacterium]|nr:two-component system, cell cycle response regulator [Solirubrobacteraceae bacterium]